LEAYLIAAYLFSDLQSCTYYLNLAKKIWWMGLAIFFHALADGVVVYFSRIGFSVLGIEAIIGIFAVLSLIIILVLRNPESSEEPVLATVSIPEFNPKPVDETIENLDRTRFQ
jgi:hypothetical protein